jgi:WD40 repeat protein
MPFFRNLTINSLESRIKQWRMQHFGLSGFDYPFSTNQRTDEGVSSLVGIVLSPKERQKILAKGGLIGPLINRLFCGIGPSRRTSEKYMFFVISRLCFLRTCPTKPLLERLLTHSSIVWDSSFNPNTKKFAVVTDTDLEVWPFNSGGREFNCKTPECSNLNRVAFSGMDTDSNLVVCSDRQISFYNGSTFKRTQQITSSATVNTVQFSPDGSVLVICLSNKTLQVLKKKQSADGTEEWVCVEILHEQTGEITSVAFYQRPEILILAIGLGDNTIKIWEISSDEGKPSCCVDTLAGHISWITSVSFHLYFKLLASGSNDKTVKVWSQNSNGQFICMLTLEHGSPVSSVAFSPSGFLASGGNIREFCKIWRIFMSATCVNAELVLTKFVEGGIDQLEFCQNTLLIRQYNGVSTLE